MAVNFTILGSPRTKKNSGRIVHPKGKAYPRILPSAAHQEWYRQALPQAKASRILNSLAGRSNGPIKDPVNCRAYVFRDALRGDAVGYYQAIADLLEAADIIADDKWIVSWDGSRLLKDAVNPRIEIELSPAGAGEVSR